MKPPKVRKKFPGFNCFSVPQKCWNMSKSPLLTYTLLGYMMIAIATMLIFYSYYTYYIDLARQLLDVPAFSSGYDLRPLHHLTEKNDAQVDLATDKSTEIQVKRSQVIGSSGKGRCVCCFGDGACRSTLKTKWVNNLFNYIYIYKGNPDRTFHFLHGGEIPGALGWHCYLVFSLSLHV